MQLQTTGLSTIHFEFTEEYKMETVTNVESGHKPIIVEHPDTRKQNGILLRWTTRVYTSKGTLLSLVAEETYLSDDISEIDERALRMLIESAFQKYSNYFTRKVKEVWIEMQINYTVQNDHLQDILKQFRPF